MRVPEPVNTTGEHPRDSYRLLIIRRNATELLLTAAGRQFSLPFLEIPAWERVAPLLVAAMKEQWEFDAHSLFTVSNTETFPCTSQIHYQVMEPSMPNRKPAKGLRWVPVASLSDGSFADRGDYGAIRSAITQLEGYTNGSLHGPFGKPSWIREVFTWVEREVNQFGLCVTGQFRQLNASPTFSLIRFETNGPAVWFKAVGEPNLQEYSITTTLAKLFPDYVSRILATRPEWNAWLAVETEGTHPDEHSGLQIWTVVAKRLANLQLATSGQELHLIDNGCRDVRVSSLVELVNPFLETMAEVMEQQIKTTPAPLSRAELSALSVQLRDMFGYFDSALMPNVLGHLDFNPGNILVSEEHCVFLDWAEACVGHPFITFEYLTEHLRRLRPNDKSWVSRVTSAYLEKWRPFFHPEEITIAAKAAPLVALFAYAAIDQVWRDPIHIAQPDTAKYLRSLTRRLKQEMDRWTAERSVPSLICLD
jgi:hypothetical protein